MAFYGKEKEMKKDLRIILLCFCMTMVAISGCGNNTELNLEDNNVTIEENQPTEEPTEEPTETPAKEPVEEPTEEPEEEPAKDWFGEQGLVITPQGSFTFTTRAYNESRIDTDTFEVNAYATISESTKGVEEGYKEVTIVWDMDFSATDEFGQWYSALAFDRYTGTAFAFDSETQLTVDGETSIREGFVTIVNGDESYDVSILSENTGYFPNIFKIITVTCPVDYDGVVFYIGYWDREMNTASAELNFTERLYTIDELPAYGDGYYYFSYSNE